MTQFKTMHWAKDVLRFAATVYGNFYLDWTEFTPLHSITKIICWSLIKLGYELDAQAPGSMALAALSSSIYMLCHFQLEKIFLPRMIFC